MADKVKTEESKPDAVLVERRVAKGAKNRDIALWAKATYGPVLKSPLVWVRTVPGGSLLLTGDAADAMQFGNDHERAGEECYTWTEAGDGVRYGTLTVKGD